MSFAAHELENDRIIVLNLHPNYDLLREIQFSNQAVKDILAVRNERFTLITVLHLKLTIEEITYGASVVGRGRDSLWHHPQIRQVVLVSDDDAIKQAAAGMASTAFGNLQVAVFDHVEAAIAFAKASAAPY